MISLPLCLILHTRAWSLIPAHAYTHITYKPFKK
jgi:hypothetical protein